MKKTYDPTARASQLGYKYQDLYALFLLLSKPDVDSYITYESKDDIVLYTKSKESLYQIKYKQPNKLSDRSKDFWTTMRNWCTEINKNEIDLKSSRFVLVTTEKIPADSVIFKIKNKKYNKDEIVKRLQEISNEGNNKANFKSYKEVKKTIDNSPNSFYKLIDCIEILDDVKFTYDVLMDKVKNCLQTDEPNLLFDRLIGWWNNQIVDCLQMVKGVDRKIKYEDLKNKIISENKAIDHYKFPVFPEDRDVKDIRIEDFVNMKFVKQLKIIDCKNETTRAIKDFYRAKKKLNYWANNLSNDLKEIDNFESKLIEYWERYFERIKDIEGNIEKEEAGKKLYISKYVESQPDIYIGNTKETFLTVGNSHILANQLRIGWHPNYNDILNDDN